MQDTATQSPKQPVLCSHGADVRSGNIRPFEFASLRAFAGWLKQLPGVSEKIDSQYIVGARFSGHQRTLQTMTGASIIQMDFDKPSSADQRAAVCAVLESLGIGFVAFDSFSNGGKFVVLLPLAQPATVGEHKATLDYIVRELGLYAAGLDPASYNPVLPRFVSPNINSAERTFDLNDAPFLMPVEASDEASLPDNVASIAPIPSRPAITDRFQLYSDQATPEEKRLFLIALKNDLIPDRVDDYTRWQPLLYAAFRAWAINSKNMTESQREMFEVLVEWSKRSAKYKDGCVDEKLTTWLRERGNGQKLFIGSVLAVEVDQGRLRHAIEQDQSLDLDEKAQLSEAYSIMLGGKGSVSVISDGALEAAAQRRIYEAAEAAKIRLAGTTILASMPAPTERFAEFRDLLVSMSTQNSAEFWELTEDKWEHKLRPAPMLMGLVQIAAMGFSPHVLYRESPISPPKALNPYFLNIAKAGTGKSTGIKMLEQVLQNTSFSGSHCNTKLFSATGLWINFFETRGPVQLVFSEEAESLIGKVGQVDANLSSLHTMMKLMFDGALPGVRFRPSAQVQRELKELTAPWMAMHLAATPALLRNDMASSMLNDGFMSRIIVAIDERDDQDQSFDERVARKVERMGSIAVGGGIDETIAKMSKFLNTLWRDSHSPIGEDFFTPMVGEDKSQELIMHFENPDWKPRYIVPPKGHHVKFAELIERARDRWPTPPSVRGTDIESNIESLRIRSETKLVMLSSILTLIADPNATEVNLELAEWAERFLYLTEWGFYRFLLKSTEERVVSSNWRAAPDMVAKLRPACEEGGPLFGKSGCDSNTLRNFSRAWKKLIGELRKPRASREFQAAEALLSELDVEYRDGPNNKRQFYLLSGLDDEDDA